MTNRWSPTCLRPEENPELTGHETAECLLWQAWRYNRLAHAWLICGPKGIGKMTLACRFARFILAKSTADLERVDESSVDYLYISPKHPVFRRIATRSHTDFRIIECGYNGYSRHQTHILVDDIRDINKFLTFTAAEGDWRVVIIDGAETMNDSAGNALLKVLEAPLPKSLLLLISHNPRRLLSTVRSRCCILTLRPLSELQIDNILGRLRPLLTAPEALAVIHLADGSIGQALKLIDNGGIALYRDILNLLTRVPHIDVLAIYTFIDHLTKEEDRLFTDFGELFKIWLARIVRRAATGLPLTEVIPGEEALAFRLTTAVKVARWIEVLEKISYLFSQAELLNLDSRHVILSAFLAIRMASSSYYDYPEVVIIPGIQDGRM